MQAIIKFFIAVFFIALFISLMIKGFLWMFPDLPPAAFAYWFTFGVLVSGVMIAVIYCMSKEDSDI